MVVRWTAQSRRHVRPSFGYAAAGRFTRSMRRARNSRNTSEQTADRRLHEPRAWAAPLALIEHPNGRAVESHELALHVNVAGREAAARPLLRAHQSLTLS